jgi:hypothetical protein
MEKGWKLMGEVRREEKKDHARKISLWTSMINKAGIREGRRKPQQNIVITRGLRAWEDEPWRLARSVQHHHRSRGLEIGIDRFSSFNISSPSSFLSSQRPGVDGRGESVERGCVGGDSVLHHFQRHTLSFSTSPPETWTKSDEKIENSKRILRIPV